MIRVFIAVVLSPPIQKAIQDVQIELKSAVSTPYVRWIPVENIHLTLKFLGDTPASLILPIREKLNELATSWTAFDILIRGLGCFPNRKRPRVIWLGVEEEDADLGLIHEDLERGLSDLGVARETRPLRPHLTIGRVKVGVQVDEVKALLKRLEVPGQPEIGKLSVSSLHLMKSELMRSGAVYSTLAEQRFGAPT